MSTLPNSIFDDDNETSQKAHIDEKIIRGPLSLTLQQLSDQLEGSGRAAVVWDCLRAGVDPNMYYSAQHENDVSDDAIADAWLDATATTSTSSFDIYSSSACLDKHILGRRQGQGLGAPARKKLQDIMHNYNLSNNVSTQLESDEMDREKAIYTIENSIASLSHIKVSPDGTTKLLLKMRKDGLEVESVIIPWADKGFSTLCVS